MRLLDEALAQLPSGRPATPPDLDQIVCELDAILTYSRRRRAFDGATDLSSSRPVIELAWVNPSESRSLLPRTQGSSLGRARPHHYDARSRFTLAHEIAHVLVHRLGQVSDAPSMLSPAALEKFCDSLAAHILMPEDWFLNQIGPRADLAALRRTSMRAGVSISATIVRCRSLDVQTGAIFLSNSDGEWQMLRAYGIGSPAQLRFGRSAQSSLCKAQIKEVSDCVIEVRCGDHNHELIGQLRRTYHSAVVVVAFIDSDRIPSPKVWRCRY
ncbi:ImmA/IrrE family metallo-endopeptidase [Rhodococcus sp. NPDC006774]|uniref:ImmA/IrrE family metallo-endopeptidase n=1 Tax=Rhodococcus sp. NPDC006774 TaxID=3157186 RepID=UPI0033D83732